MTRIQRIDYPNAIHHVTQRGNDRQLLFETPDDYRVFLETPRIGYGALTPNSWELADPPG